MKSTLFAEREGAEGHADLGPDRPERPSVVVATRVADRDEAIEKGGGHFAGTYAVAARVLGVAATTVGRAVYRTGWNVDRQRPYVVLARSDGTARCFMRRA